MYITARAELAPFQSGITCLSPIQSSAKLFIIEDDRVQVLFSKKTLHISEDAANQNESYQIALLSRPLSSVTIQVTPQRPHRVVVQPTLLVFTPLEWNIPKMVTVVAVDDKIDNVEIDTRFDLIHNISSSDESYDALSYAVKVGRSYL